MENFPVRSAAIAASQPASQRSQPASAANMLSREQHWHLLPPHLLGVTLTYLALFVPVSVCHGLTALLYNLNTIMEVVSPPPWSWIYAWGVNRAGMPGLFYLLIAAMTAAKLALVHAVGSAV